MVSFLVFISGSRGGGGGEVGIGALWESPFSQKQESYKKEFKIQLFPLIVLNTKILKKTKKEKLCNMCEQKQKTLRSVILSFFC